MDTAEFNKKNFAFATGGVNHQEGMSKYEYVSAQILASICSKEGVDDLKRRDWAPRVACDVTDALFMEWENRKK